MWRKPHMFNVSCSHERSHIYSYDFVLAWYINTHIRFFYHYFFFFCFSLLPLLNIFKDTACFWLSDFKTTLWYDSWDVGVCSESPLPPLPYPRISLSHGITGSEGCVHVFWFCVDFRLVTMILCIYLFFFQFICDYYCWGLGTFLFSLGRKGKGKWKEK